MTSSPPPSLQEVWEENRLVYHTIASSTFLMWNHCITLCQEIDLVWRATKKWTLTNFLFCILRYLSLSLAIVQIVVYTNISGLLRPSPTTCHAWEWFRTAGGPILLYCAETLLILRVYAFYDRTQGVLVGLLVPRMIIIPRSFPANRFGICLVTSSPSQLSHLWTPTIIVEIILFAFVATRAIQSKPWIMRYEQNILVVLVRDGSWAFICIFAVCLWTTIASRVNHAQEDIALAWGITLQGYCGTHLVLNLRSEALRTRSATTLNTHLGMAFLDNSSMTDPGAPALLVEDS
ncbi:hypothetical protein JB92DRAFT_1380124 [Gautieria morchelliformis]|nr:hypothetical protein JB92DRAFT_1380124 [Gautieria morchelliformis]